MLNPQALYTRVDDSHTTLSCPSSLFQTSLFSSALHWNWTILLIILVFLQFSVLCYPFKD